MLFRSVCAEVVAQSGEAVEAANFNEPRQTVIAGSRTGVDLACQVLKAQGAKRTLLLTVSAPFHSSLMKPAAEALRQRLEAVPFNSPRMPVVNNIDVAVQTTPEALRDALVRQAYGPVRWVEVIHALRDRGLRHIVECGPGKVLTNLVRRIDSELVPGGVHDPASLSETKGLLL